MSILDAVAQCIPISLLELNIFGHALCALLIYCIWWEKPFEVDYPTIIHNQLLWDATAFEWMRTHGSSVVDTIRGECINFVEQCSGQRDVPKVSSPYTFQYI